MAKFGAAPGRQFVSPAATPAEPPVKRPHTPPKGGKKFPPRKAASKSRQDMVREMLES